MKEKTKISFLWSLNSKFSMIFFEFFTQLILARLLFPKDFGIIAIVMVFINFGRAITNGGLSQALIQRKNSDVVEESSVFYFNLLIGTTFAFVVFFLSGYAAEYYSHPILKEILRVISFWFIINAFGLIQDMKLTKDLNFKAKFKVNIISVVSSAILGIFLAVFGFEVWALVVQIMISQFFRILLLWRISSWRPLLVFKWPVLRKLLPYGFNILLSSIFTGFRVNIFAIVIGKTYTVNQLGFYNRANQLQNITSKTFTTSLQNVLFPVFSKLQDDMDLLRKGLKKSIKYLFFVITPLMVFFIVNAEDIIVILLTEKWIESAKYLKLLSLLGIIYPLQMMNLNVLKAINLSNKFLYTTLLWDILSIFSAIITSFYTIEIMILGQVAVTLACYVLNVIINGKYYKYNLKEQIKDLLPLILINVAFYLVLNMVFTIIPVFNLYLSMLINVLLGSLIYGLLVYVCYNKFFKELMIELQGLKKKKH